MPTDALLAAARFVVREDLKDLRAAVDGLPADALNWKPGGDDTNSAAVLVTHVLNSTRWWLSNAVGAPLPDRDRASEFRVTEDNPGALTALVDEFRGDIGRVLDGAADVDWGAARKTHAASGDGPENVPAAWALLHAIEHLREHVAHVSLTRQLWEARGR
jgi:hypothetical protein